MGEPNNALAVYMNRPERIRDLLEYYLGAGLPEDWECLYEAELVAKLDWLEFNLKRTLGLEGGEDDKQLGASMVKWALRHLRYYVEKKDEILNGVV